VHKVIILPKALQDLSRLDKPAAQRVVDKITWLSENIESITPMTLKGGLSRFYKLRAGDWRIIYDINPSEKIITIHKIGHRREIYK
jgi:mRNA interferase RelE/StbE